MQNSHRKEKIMDIKLTLITMYITLMSTIIAGIVNSIWCKTKYMKVLQAPMDKGKNFIDGKRIFGDNKTWKGFIGYIILNIVFTVIWGGICSVSGLEAHNMFYETVQNNPLNNVLIGFLLGFAYALFELPNSFIKRRLDIVPGKSISGFLKVFFVFFDQADSIFGCVLVVCIYAAMSVRFYFVYVLVGAVTHILINMLLYCLKLRKNPF